MMVVRKGWRCLRSLEKFDGRERRRFVTTSWVSVSLASNDSILTQARNPIMCLRFEKKSENKTQRTICLPQLVGLALVEEDLGKMDKLWSTTYTHACCWIQMVMGGWLIAFCGLTPFADWNSIVFSSKWSLFPVPLPKFRCVRLVCTGWGRTQRYP